jgi:DNA-binding IclR family transcriptional regulator
VLSGHRVLSDMVAVRLLDRTDAGYHLGGHLFELGMRAWVERSLLEVAIPFLEELNAGIHETVHLGVLDGTDVVYLTKIGGRRQASAPSRIGGRMPAHCTAPERLSPDGRRPEAARTVEPRPARRPDEVAFSRRRSPGSCATTYFAGALAAG